MAKAKRTRSNTNKTQPTEASVEEYLAAISDEDQDVLKAVIAGSVAELKRLYP
jgi:FixJ family two-component response regulator